MDRKRKLTCSNPRLAFGLLWLSTALVALLTYRGISTCFFTATDSLTLIETSRVHSLKDVVHIFCEPLMSGTGFDKMGAFYRPVSTLSYSLDYAVWRLDPYGYHLTDLLLHVGVSLLVFTMMCRLTSGELPTSWLAGLLFATHPILVESVPAVARRHDMVAAVFLLLALLSFLKSVATTGRSRAAQLLMSLVSYIAAVGAKETGIIFPAIVFAYFLVYPASDHCTRRQKIAAALRGTMPYWITTLVLLAWRVHVLHGVGGYPYGSVLVHAIRVATILPSYFMDLVCPTDVLGLLYNCSAHPSQKAGAILGLCLLLILLLVCWRTLLGLVADSDKLPCRVLKLLLAVVAVVSITVLIAYPFIPSIALHCIHEGYRGHGPIWFVQGLRFCRSLADSHGVPVQADPFWVQRAIDLGFGSALAFSTLSFAVIHQRRRIRQYLISTTRGRLVAFLLAWMLLPLVLYLLTQTFAHRFMYIPVIPFAAILALLLADAYQALPWKVKTHAGGTWNGFSFAALRSSPEAARFAVVLVAALVQVGYSPLFHPYAEWREAAALSEQILDRLSAVMPGLPDRAVIHFYNLPAGILSYRFPHVKTAGCLADYTIESWINLQYPGKHVRVVQESRSRPFSCPEHLEVYTRTGAHGNVFCVAILPGFPTPAQALAAPSLPAVPPGDSFLQEP